MSAEQKSTVNEDILAGGGCMGALMRSLDWSTTAVGTVETWSPSLKVAVSILLNSRFPMFVWWGEDYTNIYNDAYVPMLGTTKHPQFLGQSAALCWAEIWDVVGPLADRVRTTGEPTWSEDLLLFITRNGYLEETYFTFSYSPVRDGCNGVGGVFCACSDNTERVLGERRLRTLRELATNTAGAKNVKEACHVATETLAQNLADLPFALLYLIDADGKTALLVGTSGVDVGLEISPPQVDLTLETDSWKLGQVNRTRTTEHFTDLRSRFPIVPGGAWNDPPTDAVVIPITKSGQQQLAAFLILGISLRRAFNEEYRGFFELVASNVATALNNTRAYEEERLRAEALAEIDRAKTVFFSNVSHEFRTPLTLILNPLEELSNKLDGRLQPDEREQFQLLQRNGLRLQKLVNTLLDFSRIEAGRIQAVYEPTDLASFTAELASVFRSTIEQVGMTLAIECPTLPEPVYVDRQMWEKIVLNLISNAFKFTFSGSITVRLQAVGDSVELSVEDTGVGIPETELPRLFERFYRVSGTRSRTYEGSGIGLALVQELVKLHQGTIRVKSQLSQGTTFTIAIPFGSAHLPVDRIQATRTLKSTASGTATYVEEASRWLRVAPEDGQPQAEFRLSDSFSSSTSSVSTARILLADDNADMRDYIRRLLSSSYTVQTVADGRAALNAVLENLPDLVLSDVMMPEMDGFELLQSLRANPATQDIPMILLSARAGEEARIEGLKAGADDYLFKPFSARELMARVEASLKLAQLRQQAQEREQELRLEAVAAREQVEAVLSGISDGFLVLDRDWRYTYINDRQLEIMGKQREEVLGKIVWEVFPEAVGTEAYDALQEAMTQRTPIHRETLYTPWNRWFDIRVYPNATGVSVFTTDINDRKRIEAVLRESEEQFRNMADNAPVMIWVTDPTGYCTYLSQSWYNFSGQTEDTGLGFGWLDATHPEDYENSKNMFLAANERHEAFRLEYRLRRKDGEYRFCIDAASPWFGLDGQFKGYIGSVIDITDRKHAETTVHEAEDRLRLALESAELGTWDLNPITGELKWDNGCKAMFGLSPDATVNYDVFLAGLHPDDRSRTQAAVEQATKVKSNGEYDIEYRTLGIEDGVERWIAAKGKAVFNQAGVAVRFIGTVLNITEKKRAEAEREQLLQREQTAREQAETANRIKDEFLAVLSHELRTPLNPILGWSSLLQRGKLDATKTTQALATIERNAKLQVQLIDDLLDISRILRGKLTLTVTPVSLGTVICAALETVHLAAQAKSLQIQTTIAPSIALVSGDAGRLQQVVWNLLSNAVKFTPAGGQIVVELTQVETYARIQVKDTGIGIRSDFLPYVFEHFRQEDGATTRQFGGLGLGLAIVRQIVEMHGGTVRADSPGVGGGATFTVQIPLAFHPVEIPSKERSLGSTVDLSGVHVLVVDDDADSQDFITFVLEQANANVTAVSSGVDALQIIAHSVPDIVVSDIGMPFMDGYMLMRQIRRLPVHQGGDIPAIALTAYAGEIDREQALSVGFQRHIAKPINPDAVVAIVVELVRRREYLETLTQQEIEEMAEE